MRFNRFLLPVAALAMTMTSCFNDSDDSFSQTVTNVYANCFNVVRDNVTNAVTYTPAARYTVTFVTNASGATTAEISITNLRIPDVSLTNFDLPAIKVNLPATGDKPMTANAADLVPTNVSGTTIVFDQFNFSFLNRYIFESGISTASPIYSIRFMVNGRYTVTVLPNQMLFFGKTSTTKYSDNSVFTTTVPRYAFTLDPDKKLATLDITGAQFLETMPGMNMTFAEIPFELEGNTVKFNKDALTPSIKGVPYPNFPITDLEGAVQILNTASLSFNCDADRMGKFAVKVDLTDLSDAPQPTN